VDREDALHVDWGIASGTFATFDIQADLCIIEGYGDYGQWKGVTQLEV
jgi:hypothetical protein